MRKTREEKGITLIALIITIVVLLILAVVAINAVTGDGIIQHATNAKTEYEKAQDEENSTLSYYQTYLDAEGQVGKWIQDKEVIKQLNKDGKEEKINIGAYVNYNPKSGLTDTEVSNLTYTSYALANVSSDRNNGRNSGYTSDQSISLTYTGTWQVLGVEDNQVLLVSSDLIKDEYYIKGKSAYQYAVEELNAMCSIYGHGKDENGKNIISEVRSLKVEDVNKITGYNPLTNPYRKDQLGEYGKKIIFKMIDGTVSYKLEGSNEFISSTVTTFEYLENSVWKSLQEGEQIESVATIYHYNPITLTEYDDSNPIGLKEDSETYKLLFGTGARIWLANSYISQSNEGMRTYGVRIMGTRIGYSGRLYRSDGEEGETYGGVRAVVKLNSNAILEQQADGSYNIVIE